MADVLDMSQTSAQICARIRRETLRLNRLVSARARLDDLIAETHHTLELLDLQLSAADFHAPLSSVGLLLEVQQGAGDVQHGQEQPSEDDGDEAG